MPVESYMHKYAKTVLASWLRKKIRIGEKYKGLENVPLKCSKKRPPSLDVYLEYPVCLDKQTKDIVGIVGSSCGTLTPGKDTGECLIWAEWLKKQGKKVRSKNGVPSVWEIKDTFKKELKILAVFDIGVIDNGKLYSVFEVRHKHAIDDKKWAFIKEHSLECYEIDATWIMEKVKPPFSVQLLN